MSPLSAASHATFRPGDPRLLGWVLGLLLAATLLRDLGLGFPLAIAAGSVYLLAVLLALPGLGSEVRLLLVAATLSVLGVAMVGEAPLATLLLAAERATFLASFMLSLSMLRDAARTSPAVRRCGDALVRQPPGRRYLTLMLGGHGLGFILNLGALSLLATAVREANTLDSAGSERIRAIRERRMMTAISRGFAAIMLWSPLSMSVAVLLTLIPSLTWGSLVAVSLPMAGGLLTLGWLIDRLRWPRPQRGGPGTTQEAAPLSFSVFAPVLALTAAVLLGVLLIQAIFASSFIVAVIATAPVASAIWIALQHRTAAADTPQERSPAKPSTLQRLRVIVETDFPRARREVMILSAAGIIGTCIAALVPGEAVARMIETLGLPPLALACLISLIIVLAAQVALNPIIAVTIIGGLATSGDLEALSPQLLGLCLITGWSIAVVASPFTAPCLILARVVEATPGLVGRRWNGDYTVAALLLAFVGYALLG